MTNKKAIELLDSIIPNPDVKIAIQTELYMQAIDLAIKALENSSWISVGERLPEESYGCLVTVEEDDYYGEPQAVLYPDFVGYDGNSWNDASGEPIKFEVIAWMPLPKPYTKEEQS